MKTCGLDVGERFADPRSNSLLISLNPWNSILGAPHLIDHADGEDGQDESLDDILFDLGTKKNTSAERDFGKQLSPSSPFSILFPYPPTQL